MPQEVSTSQYKILLDEISKIYLDARSEVRRQMHNLLAQAYWQIGQRIVQIEQKTDLRAEYGTRLLENLSKDLSQEFGDGFSLRNLRNMRQFYITFPIRQTSAELPWSHFQLLSSIKDKDLRERYLKEAVKKHLSVRELKERLRREGIEVALLRESAGAQNAPKLSVKHGRLLTYRVADVFITDAGIFDPAIDLGFNIYKEINSKGPRPKAGEIVESFKNAEEDYYFRKADATLSEIYTYRAQILKVIDADTLKCNIDCGFGIWTEQRLRLRAIDTPEIATRRGQKASAFVAAALKPHRFVTVKTYKSDKYDRYLTDVFYGEDAKFLNQELLDNKLATLWKN